jgi:hypothetical protein
VIRLKVANSSIFPCDDINVVDDYFSRRAFRGD